MTITDLKELNAINTLVFETLGQPEKEREFKLKSLKKWGFDLLLGKKDGEVTYFTAKSDTKKVGDRFEENNILFEVDEVINELPKNKKIFAHIEMIDGRAYLVGELREEDKNIEILKVPAGAVLMAYFKKHKFHHLIEALRNVGSALELVKHRGQEGKPVPFEELPNVARRFLREAKKIEKEAGFGRIALSYWGENKDGEPRFRVSWLLPTIALFDKSIAEKTDKTLGAFK